MSDVLSQFGALLLQTLQGSAAPEDRAASLQDSLDLVAVVAGAKPVALIGCGYPAGSWLDAVADLAIGQGLAVRRGGVPWAIAEEIDTLPDWYRKPMLASWGAADLLTIARADLLQPFKSRAPEMVGAVDGGRLLGYPSCCVIDHHARRHFYHAFVIELIRSARDGEEEQARFAASELSPPLRDASDGLRLAQALRATPVPFTSLDMCPECTAQWPHSPAGKMSATYQALAEASGLAALFMQPARLGAAEA
jgi:hypothetical protein